MRINTYFFITFNLKVSNDITSAREILGRGYTTTARVSC